MQIHPDSNTVATVTTITHSSSSSSSSSSQHRKLFDNLALRLGIKTLDEWYNVTSDQIRNLDEQSESSPSCCATSTTAGSLLMQQYGNSLCRALLTVYPEHEWLPWRFREPAPSGFWSSSEANHRRFFDWAAEQLKIENHEGWYGVLKKDVQRIGGAGLIKKYYNDSLYRALTTLYPEHEWLPWRFKMVPVGFWTNVQNHRRFFEWAATQLNVVRAPEDWYNVTTNDIINLGGRGLINGYYGHSLSRALTSVFPEHEWQPWRFQGFSNQSPFAHDATVLRQYVEYLARELHIEKLDDWYRVSIRHIKDNLGGYPILKEHGGLLAVLRAMYPEHNWDETKFDPRKHGRQKGKKAAQRLVRVAAQKLFPNAGVFEEYRQPGLMFPTSNATMTLDVCIPSLALAFEYQGEQHYRDLHALGDNATMVQKRDREKHAACASAGLTLVPVPYWWDRSAETLAAMIITARPDLASSISAAAATATATTTGAGG